MYAENTMYVYLIKASAITTILCFVLQYFNGNAKWVNPFGKKEKDLDAQNGTK